MAERKLAGQPELSEQSVLYYTASSALSGSRSAAGLGVGSIPYPVMTAWGRDHGIEDLDDLELLVWGIQALDMAFLEHLTKTKPKTG